MDAASNKSVLYSNQTVKPLGCSQTFSTRSNSATPLSISSTLSDRSAISVGKVGAGSYVITTPAGTFAAQGPVLVPVAIPIGNRYLGGLVINVAADGSATTNISWRDSTTGILTDTLFTFIMDGESF